VRSYHCSEIALEHYTLGTEGTKALAAALRTNRFLRAINLRDNAIGGAGGRALASAMQGNGALERLNVSKNRLGTAAATAIFQALPGCSGLRFLDVSSNGIHPGAAGALADGLSGHPSLRSVDLGDNQLGDAGARAVGAALGTAWPVESIRLGWNNVGPEGTVTICNKIKHHQTLQHLDLSWNRVHDLGAFALGQVLARTRSLRSLDVRHNGIGPRGIMIVAEGLKLNLNSVEELDCSHNPLGHLGVELLLRSKPECPSVTRYGLQETSVGDPGAAARVHPLLGVPDYNGYFSLDLSAPFDRAVADLLNIRKHRRGGLWRDVRLDGRPYDMYDFQDKFEGRLEMFFIDSDSLAPKATKPPTVHFSLDLAKRDDRSLLNGLVERSYREPGTNLRNVFVGGQRRDLEAEMRGAASVESLGPALVELDYCSSSLYHQNEYALDLSVGKERAVVHKLLERVYETTAALRAAREAAVRKTAEAEALSPTPASGRGAQGHGLPPLYEDRWVDASYNGKPFTLERWAIHFERIAGSATKTTLAGNVVAAHEGHVRKTSEKSSWRVPEHGALSFKHVSANPVNIESRHHRFDMSAAASRTAVVNFWMRASQLPGRSLFNCFHDGKPFHFDESLWRERKMLKTLPTAGALEFDFVVAVVQETSRRMQRSSLRFQLGDHEEREQALSLLLRQQRGGGQLEFWMNVKVGQRPLPPKEFLAPAWVMPSKGALKVEVAFFPAYPAMPDEQFVVVLEDLLTQTGPKEMLVHLAYVCTRVTDGENVTGEAVRGSRYFTSRMAGAVLAGFHQVKDQWEALKLLLPLVVDPHCSREMHDALLDRPTRRELWKWMALEPAETSPLLAPGAPYPFDAAERPRLQEKKAEEAESAGVGEKARQEEAKQKEKRKKKRHSIF
jgi:Ran GTPase-activating protein (RanGAP) involved in mRNA processing and transport